MTLSVAHKKRENTRHSGEQWVGDDQDDGKDKMQDFIIPIKRGARERKKKQTLQLHIYYVPALIHLQKRVKKKFPYLLHSRSTKQPFKHTEVKITTECI